MMRALQKSIVVLAVATVGFGAEAAADNSGLLRQYAKCMSAYGRAANSADPATKGLTKAAEDRVGYYSQKALAVGSKEEMAQAVIQINNEYTVQLKSDPSNFQNLLLHDQKECDSGALKEIEPKPNPELEELMNCAAARVGLMGLMEDRKREGKVIPNKKAAMDKLLIAQANSDMAQAEKITGDKSRVRSMLLERISSLPDGDKGADEIFSNVKNCKDKGL